MITGFLAFLRGVWTWLGNIMRRIGEWLREPHDWWRIGCFSAAMVCVFMAVKWRDAEQREKDALDRVVTVTETYKIKLIAADNKLSTERQVCESNRQKANAEALGVKATLEAKNRQLERQLATAMAQITSIRNEERERAKDKGDAVAAGIRAGTVQLQDWWGGQAGGNGASGNGAVPGASAAATVDDDAADLRATDTGRIVEIAAKCDADIIGLQSALKAEREAK